MLSSVGIEEGRQEGEEYGRMDEREKALQAFDRFLSGNLKQTGSRSGMSDGSGDVDNIAVSCDQFTSRPNCVNVCDALMFHSVSAHTTMGELSWKGDT